MSLILYEYVQVSWCLDQQLSRRRRLRLQPVTLTRLRDSPGRRSNTVRYAFWNTQTSLTCHNNFYQEKYLLLLTEVGIEAPTKADFEAADLDANGALLFKEWKDWAAEQI